MGKCHCRKCERRRRERHLKPHEAACGNVRTIDFPRSTCAIDPFLLSPLLWTPDNAPRYRYPTC